MKLNIFKNFFKRKHPYLPVAYLGRKTVERSLGADIVKQKKLVDIAATEPHGSKLEKKHA
ncbi:hypothetical protein [Glaciecola sp. SC05]|uniref:hypothetical protein n=1 Tax=Glaciecola sp. SC05 TaxID=1987355 RepID=UPI0035276195